MFNFGNIVVVENDLVGVVVKCWEGNLIGYNYDVYVRSLNSIKNYPEGEIRHIIYHKELTECDKEYY
jgi:hypothetical protein